ncbi:MAG: hypothetical protein KDJ29_19690 [Hyphomicrobiales bacterium]|nr:hypothetical protein [Hyphomicrobiales bacterium]
MDDETAKKLDQIDMRLGKVEGRVTSIEKEQAVQAVKSQAIADALKTIQGNLSKLLWLVAGGFVSAGIAWIVSGGLKIGG